MALAITETRPAYDATAKEDDLDYIRNNIMWLVANVGDKGYLPGWDTEIDPSNLDAPTYIELTKGSMIIRFNYTYTSTLVTEIEIEFDDGLGGGLVTLTGGTMTLTYNGSDELTGITSA